jgi:NDP-sugar pyrophosphorylase family protein
LTAAILVGGLGTRLRSVVADRPKVLAQVGGRPFLAYLLDQLAVSGIKNVVFCTGYLSEQVQAEFGASYRGLHLSYSQEPAPRGTAGALRLALPRFQSDSVLTMNGDSFCEVDLSAFWSWHRMRGAEATLFLTKMPDTRRYGRVAVSAEGRLLKFDEKDAHDGPGWINTGIYLLSLPLLQSIPMGQAVSLEREMVPAWLGRGIYGYQSEARFLDIGTPESYAAAEQFFARMH